MYSKSLTHTGTSCIFLCHWRMCGVWCVYSKTAVSWNPLLWVIQWRLWGCISIVPKKSRLSYYKESCQGEFHFLEMTERVLNQSQRVPSIWTTVVRTCSRRRKGLFNSRKSNRLRNCINKKRQNRRWFREVLSGCRSNPEVFWFQACANVLVYTSSWHMGRLTNVKTLYSIMMEKQRKMAYSTSTYMPSLKSNLHLFTWMPNTWMWRNKIRSQKFEMFL